MVVIRGPEPGLGELRAAPEARAYYAATSEISSIETSKRERGGGFPSGGTSCQYAARRAHAKRLISGVSGERR